MKSSVGPYSSADAYKLKRLCLYNMLPAISVPLWDDFVPSHRMKLEGLPYMDTSGTGAVYSWVTLAQQVQ